MGLVWIKLLLEFLADIVAKVLTAEVKSSDAKTTDETRTRFQKLKDRFKRPAAGDDRKP